MYRTNSFPAKRLDLGFRVSIYVIIPIIDCSTPDKKGHTHLEISLSMILTYSTIVIDLNTVMRKITILNNEFVH